MVMCKKKCPVVSFVVQILKICYLFLYCFSQKQKMVPMGECSSWLISVGNKKK